MLLTAAGTGLSLDLCWKPRDALVLLRSAHRVKDFSASHPSLEERGAGGTQLIQGISHSTMLRAQHTEPGKEEEEDVHRDGICPPKPPQLMVEPNCAGMAELLPMESQERILWLALIA